MKLSQWKEQYILDHVGSVITLDDLPITVDAPSDIAPGPIEITLEFAEGVLNKYSAE